MFESDFLTTSPDAKGLYQRLISESARIVASIPDQPYSGGTPSQLRALLNLDFLPAVESSPHQVAATLGTVVANSIHVAHPHTAAHLHCPPLLASLAAEVVISALNQSMDSFDQAPIATLVEQELVRWLCAHAGLPSSAGGTFTTGGSQSNYMGLLLARDAVMQKKWGCSVQKSGLPPEARRLRILCSEVAHFTVEKSASQLGLGTGAVVRVSVDDGFRMNPNSLRESLQALPAQGLLPMAIVATAGTTDFGSIDPLPEIATLARSESTWLHVDAAYGGALLFSDTHRHKLSGIESADSLSVDFHKLLWQSIPCSAFFLSDARNFNFIKMNADYLNPESHEEEGIPNLVTNSLLTTRRFDALKLSISLQSLGRAKLSAMIDRTIELAHHAAAVVRRAPRLELMCEPSLSAVVFRYVPAHVNLSTDSLNAGIRQALFNRGVAVIGHTRVRNQQCLKFTCMNPSATEEQMDALIRMVVEEGQRFEQISQG